MPKFESPSGEVIETTNAGLIAYYKRRGFKSLTKTRAPKPESTEGSKAPDAPQE